MKHWLFKLFTRRIEIKISKLKDDARILWLATRILWLANRLFNELESQGYDVRGSVDNMEHIDIYYHPQSDKESAMEVINWSKGWSVRGRRT